MAIFRALHTATGGASRARFAQDMGAYASTIVILTAAGAAGVFVGNFFSGRPTFEQVVAEKMEAMEAMDAKLATISTTATTISTTATTISATVMDMSTALSDLLKKGK